MRLSCIILVITGDINDDFEAWVDMRQENENFRRFRRKASKAQIAEFLDEFDEYLADLKYGEISGDKARRKREANGQGSLF